MCLTLLSPAFVAAVLFAPVHASGKVGANEPLEGHDRRRTELKDVTNMPELFNHVSDFLQSSQRDLLGLRVGCTDLKQACSSRMFDMSQKSTSDYIFASRTVGRSTSGQLPRNLRLNLDSFWLEMYICSSERRAEINGLVLDPDTQVWSSATKLDLLFCRWDGEISAISKFTQLVSLTLHGAAVSDLRPLENLINLESLDFVCYDYSVGDLTPLVNLPNLSWLSLKNCGLTGELDQLKPLVGLPNLRFLDLKGTNLPDIPQRGFFTHSLTYINHWGRTINTCSSSELSDY